MVAITSTRGGLVSPCLLGLFVVQIEQSFNRSIGRGEVFYVCSYSLEFAHGFSPSVNWKILSSSDICRMSNMSNENCLTYSRMLLVCLKSRNFLLAMTSTFLGRN